jgi:hypothetical protein
MGSLEAMTQGSDQRYLGDTAKLKIAQGVVGAVKDKGSVLKFIPYTLQAVRQGFQDIGANSLQSAHDLLRSRVLRLEVWLTESFCYLFLTLVISIGAQTQLLHLHSCCLLTDCRIVY